MSSLETEPAEASETPSSLQIRTSILLIGFSVIYLADVCLRASEKYLWFDEICTVYQAHLSLHGLWGALRAGFDFNPPLLYLLTKLANFLFGGGLITARLPEIIGFWIFSLCLFRFVSKRAGEFAGFSAMALPMFTGAFYYSYDARPHGLVLAFCGLALVAWQKSLETQNKSGSLIAFSLALFAAFMTHCYAITLAVPFALAEVIQSARARRIEPRRWTALAVPTLLAMVTYLPLLRAYHETSRGTVWLTFSPLQWSQIGGFYAFLLAPCVLMILLIILLMVLEQISAVRPRRAVVGELLAMLRLETALAVAFLLLPLFGFLLALKMHSPFYDRYFLSALAGFCILAGFGVGFGKRANWAPMVLAAAMGLGLLIDVSSVLWNRAHGRAASLVEPSSGFSMNSSLKGPLADYQMLVSGASKGERIVVMWPMDFLYLVNYAPELRSQLYYIGWDNQDVFFRVLSQLRPYAPFAYHAVTAGEFYASRADFMFFGLPSDPGQLHVIAGDITLKSLQFSNGRFLAEVGLKPPKS